ncbi:MAG: alpha/beta fold hydrolase [Acidimicrobiia bacterium]|nr:alpha/beta fold hydrolase [Acidimicrobiia bacterium]
MTASRRRRVGVPASLGAVGAVAGALGLKAWYGSFDWCTTEDEVCSVPTEDGWHIVLHRYRPTRRTHSHPLVIGHGFAGSHYLHDLGAGLGMARFLADHGWETFTVDLRGRGDSFPDRGDRSSLQWSFDDLALTDLPSAAAAACEATGAESCLWVGHEMSGQALYAAAVSGRAENVHAAVTIGAPAVTPPYAAVPGVTAPPRGRKAGRVPFRAGARLAGPVLAFTRSRMLESSFRAGIADPRAVARYFRNGVPDESELLAEQFAAWIESAAMTSDDGSLVYSDHLDAVTLPVLVVAAAADLQRPPEAVEATYRALGSSDKTFLRAGIEGGMSVDFGHDDVVTSIPATREVLPRLEAWLSAHD